MFSKIAISLMVIGAQTLAHAEQNAVELTVKISNVQSQVGPLMLALVTDPTDFPDAAKPSTIRGVAVPNGDGVSYQFKDLRPGKYAVSVYQDLNSNSKLDANFLGIPKEPYGLSGKPGFGKPKFEDCAFEIKESMTMDIKLKN